MQLVILLIIIISIVNIFFTEMGFGTVIVDLLSNFYGLSKNEIKSTKEVARGLGTHIKWMLLEDGLMEAEKNGRPIMVVIHKSTCRACLVCFQK